MEMQDEEEEDEEPETPGTSKRNNKVSFSVRKLLSVFFSKLLFFFFVCLEELFPTN